MGLVTKGGSGGGHRAAGFGGFIGHSPAMLHLYDIIETVAASEAPVFITGESGTGKELAAEALHRYSSRAQEPFVVLNCAAIPRELMESEFFGHARGAFTGATSDYEGAVQRAHGGTLFLDEISEMDLHLQTKLLRFLQDFKFQKVGGKKQEKVDIRLLCASNRDPLLEVKAGKLRPDLFYRLHVVPLHLPPLRERGQDILDLATFFLQVYTRQEKKIFTGFSKDVCEALLS